MNTKLQVLCFFYNIYSESDNNKYAIISHKVLNECTYTEILLKACSNFQFIKWDRRENGAFYSRALLKFLFSNLSEHHLSK